MSTQSEEAQKLLKQLEPFGIGYLCDYPVFPNEETFQILLKEREEWNKDLRTRILERAETYVRSQTSGHQYSSKDVALNWYKYASSFFVWNGRTHKVRSGKVNPNDYKTEVLFELNTGHLGIKPEDYQRLKPSKVEELAFYLCGMYVDVDEKPSETHWGN